MDSGLSKFGFKRKTYSEILEDMEARAKELFGESVNLSERSPLGMFLQTIAWELSNVREEIENSYYNSSALNAVGQALDDIVNNFGRRRFDGVKARGTIKIIGDEGTTVNAGFIVGTRDGLLFDTTESVTIPAEGEVTIEIEAKEIGTEYNIPAETITEIINPMAGVREIINEEPTTGGADIETDEQLRFRHLEALREPTTGDNAAQYKVWAREVKGVGNVKVLPTTPTKGYVTIAITDSNNQPADTELMSEVFEYIDKLRPINAGIYVESATAKPIDISASVRLADGYNIQDVQNRFIDAIEEYFSNISLVESYVSYAQVGKLLLETRGVIDYDNLTLNGNVANVELGNIEVPILGDIVLGVV